VLKITTELSLVSVSASVSQTQLICYDFMLNLTKLNNNYIAYNGSKLFPLIYFNQISFLYWSALMLARYMLARYPSVAYYMSNAGRPTVGLSICGS